MGAQVEQLPPELRVHAERLRGRVYMYELPANVNRRSEVTRATGTARPSSCPLLPRLATLAPSQPSTLRPPLSPRWLREIASAPPPGP